MICTTLSQTKERKKVTIRASDRLDPVRSDIRGPLYEEALRMKAAGTEVLMLNTGNPGRFGFSLPESLRAALLSRLDEAVPYCDVRGMRDAREAVARYHRERGIEGASPDDVFLSNGVSEAATMLATALLGTGEELLLPSPCYSLWSNAARLADAVPVFYRCDPANGWQPDLDDIKRKIGPRTKAILVIDPNNPTGAVYGREVLEGIAALARERGLVLIADEIYDRLVLDGAPFLSLASLAPDLPCVTLNGLSKSHIVCGFRCGWMLFSGPAGVLDEVRAGVMKLAAMRLCGNVLSQLAVPAALADRAFTREMLEGRLRGQRDVFCRALDGIDGVSYVKNRAAFYLFPGLERERFSFASAEEFALSFLREERVLVIPGSGFDWTEDLRFRVVMLPEAPVLRDAADALGRFLSRHRR